MTQKILLQGMSEGHTVILVKSRKKAPPTNTSATNNENTNTSNTTNNQPNTSQNQNPQNPWVISNFCFIFLVFVLFFLFYSQRPIFLSQCIKKQEITKKTTKGCSKQQQ